MSSKSIPISITSGQLRMRNSHLFAIPIIVFRTMCLHILMVKIQISCLVLETRFHSERKLELADSLSIMKLKPRDVQNFISITIPSTLESQFPTDADPRWTGILHDKDMLSESKKNFVWNYLGHFDQTILTWMEAGPLQNFCFTCFPITNDLVWCYHQKHYIAKGTLLFVQTSNLNSLRASLPTFNIYWE